MENATPENASSFRFSIRALMVLLTICAVLVASCVAINRSLNRKFGVGPYYSFDEWPRALKTLIGDNRQLKEEVVPMGLSDFIDHSSIWKISANSQLREQISKQHTLEPVDRTHPNAKMLIECAPSSWKTEFNFTNGIWHATPGYGTSHIEGLDLFLIVDDPDTGVSIVLHEWLF